jgi:phenylacetic acid degradation protein
MIETYDGHTPIVPESCFVHPLACLMGKVELGELCIVLPGAAVTGDTGRVRIGSYARIEENCVIHPGTFDEWQRGVESILDIGDNVVIGHGAVVHARSIGPNTLIGMNATILEGVEVGAECVIAAGSVVKENMLVPDRSFVAGVPATIRGPVEERHLARGRLLAEVNRQDISDSIRKLKGAVAAG